VSLQEQLRAQKKVLLYAGIAPPIRSDCPRRKAEVHRGKFGWEKQKRPEEPSGRTFLQEEYTTRVKYFCSPCFATGRKQEIVSRSEWKNSTEAARFCGVISRRWPQDFKIEGNVRVALH
jgi:hypothetical protein